MSIELLLFALILAAGTIIIAFNKDSSIFIILSLIASVVVAGALAYLLNLPFLLLIASLPIGIFLAWLARDEIGWGRRWFSLLALVSAVGGATSLVIHNVPSFYASFFICLVSLTSLYLSRKGPFATREFKKA